MQSNTKNTTYQHKPVTGQGARWVPPEKPKTAQQAQHTEPEDKLVFNIEAFKMAYDAVLDYDTKRVEYAAERIKAHSSFIGATLDEAISGIDIADRGAQTEMNAIIANAQQSIVDAAVLRRDAAITQGRADSMDGSRITPDFGLLRLPVTLTETELQTLIDKNWCNPLFTRAAKEYAIAHKISGALNFSNAYDHAINVVNRTFGWLTAQSGKPGGGQLLRDNPAYLQSLDSDLAEALTQAGMHTPTQAPPPASTSPAAQHPETA